MRAARSRFQTDAGACWSIFWRSVLYAPLLLLFFVLAGGVWLSRWLLPPVVILFLFVQLWADAGLCLVAWLAAVLIYRGLRLERFHEVVPSLL